MRAEEWDLIEAGDLLDYTPPSSKGNPNPARFRFQVWKLEGGKVYAVRMAGNRDDGTASFSVTEQAVLSAPSDRWTLVRCKSKVVATGGFIVQRADGGTEYDKCPTAIEKSRRVPQTLEGLG